MSPSQDNKHALEFEAASSAGQQNVPSTSRLARAAEDTVMQESNEPTAHHEQAPQGAQAQAKEPEDEETQLEAELALVTRMKDKWERELGLITTKKTALELQLRNLRAKRELAATREELEWWRKYGPMLQDWDQGRIDVQALREVFDMEGLKEMLRRHEDGA